MVWSKAVTHFGLHHKITFQKPLYNIDLQSMQRLKNRVIVTSELSSSLSIDDGSAFSHPMLLLTTLNLSIQLNSRFVLLHIFNIVSMWKLLISMRSYCSIAVAVKTVYAAKKKLHNFWRYFKFELKVRAFIFVYRLNK